MIEKSENISNLAKSLLDAQRVIGKAIKGSENPYFKSKYADLSIVIDAVKEPLNSHGISFLQAVDENGEGKPVVNTILLHESGQFISCRTPVFCNKPNDPQAFGSGVTYSKRYALQALLGLPTEDDDAEAVAARNEKQSKTEKKPEFQKAPAEDLFKNAMEKPDARAEGVIMAIGEYLQKKCPDGFNVDYSLLADAIWKEKQSYPKSNQSKAEKLKLIETLETKVSEYVVEAA